MGNYMEYIICYMISDPSNPWEIIKSDWKRGHSEEELEEWAKENNITNYIISLPTYKVKHLRETIDGLNKALGSVETTIHNLKTQAQYEE